MTFENIIKRVSQVLAAAFMFLMADGFYLSQKGFNWVDGSLVLVKPAEASVPAAAGGVVPSRFEMNAAHVLGSADAPVTIYEFSSLGCSHCADFHLNMLPELKKDYIDSGKVKLVFADFPIDAKSMKGAMLARCMPADRYFDFLSLLFKKQLTWGLSFKTEKLLTSYAELEGLSAEKAKACMEDDDAAKEIMSVRQDAMEKLQIQGTPSFLIRSDLGEEVLPGVPDYEKLKEVMEFPAAMTFKVAGVNRENLAQDIVAVIQKYLPGDYIPKEKLSSKGTYNSVSIDIVAQNFEQVETLYKELAKVEGVKMVI